MAKYRIVKETDRDGDVWYLIQKRWFFFFWNDCDKNGNDITIYYEVYRDLDYAKKKMESFAKKVTREVLK